MSPVDQRSRRAVIDVGTNSVKLLVADVDGDGVTPILEVGEQTRLGRGFYESHRLQPQAIELTASVIAQFARRAVALEAESVRPFATSAARDALNADDLKSSIEQASGLMLTVISGETEAEWAFQGAMTNPRLANGRLFLVDVGGGSTEIILGEHGRRTFEASYRLGTVRTLEALSHSDPPTPAELELHREWLRGSIRAEIAQHLNPVMEAFRRSDPVVPPQLAATGGTATILASMDLGLTAFDRDRIEAVRLKRETVTRWADTLWRLPLAQRRQLPGLPPPRADVMLAGVLIFEAIMAAYQFDELHVSTRGVRFAAVRELWRSEVRTS